MRLMAVCATALLAASAASAFEVKGISPGADVGSIDLKACRALANADSGLPGHECDTTYAGSPATMRLAVADGRVVAVVVSVASGDFYPTLKALEEKFGSARKENRYIDKYEWSNGERHLSIEKNRIKPGYGVISVDLGLFRAVTKRRTENAKGDL